jgi:hydrogenase nickel incorporation protein HypB
MASPGAGKTSLFLQTIQALSSRIRIRGVEGDAAPVTIDVDKIIEVGMPAAQINTGGDYYLDAVMLQNGLEN